MQWHGKKIEMREI